MDEWLPMAGGTGSIHVQVAFKPHMVRKGFRWLIGRWKSPDLSYPDFVEPTSDYRQLRVAQGHW